VRACSFGALAWLLTIFGIFDFYGWRNKSGGEHGFCFLKIRKLGARGQKCAILNWEDVGRLRPILRTLIGTLVLSHNTYELIRERETTKQI